MYGEGDIDLCSLFDFQETIQRLKGYLKPRDKLPGSAGKDNSEDCIVFCHFTRWKCHEVALQVKLKID